jgi:hypothetical protein
LGLERHKQRIEAEVQAETAFNAAIYRPTAFSISSNATTPSATS